MKFKLYRQRERGLTLKRRRLTGLSAEKKRKNNSRKNLFLGRIEIVLPSKITMINL